MTNKAYIVTNEQQEREVLEKLEKEGLVWFDGADRPTEWLPSHDAPSSIDFPIALIDKCEVIWCEICEVEDDYEVVYDGRKE